MLMEALQKARNMKLDCHNSRSIWFLVVFLSLMASSSVESYELEVKWGSHGTANGQFDHPRGVAIDPLGNVYVADTSNHRIQKFDSNGNFITKWGSFGTGDGQFNLPTDVTVDMEGYVYVADSGNQRIQKFDLNGNFIVKWDVTKANFFGLGGIASDSFGNTYVAVYYDCSAKTCSKDDTAGIRKYDPHGNLIAKWGDSQFIWTSGVAVDSSDNVYVADAYYHRIQRFDSNGNVLTEWGSQGSGNGQFSSPNGIAIDLLGGVYVADTGNDRIQKFDSEGIFITRWGSEGTGAGQFQIPSGVAADLQGKVYVVDGGNDRIQKFTLTGQETISTPNLPDGPAKGNIEIDYTYSASASLSNLGHSVEYQFDWGDKTYSNWSSLTSASKSWSSTGTYAVRAKARCGVDTTVESDWSPVLTVAVTDLADLMGQWISLTQTCKNTKRGPKCNIIGKLTIQNIGSENAPSCLVKVFLSEGPVFNGGTDVLLKSMITGSIRIGASKTKQISYSLPLQETGSGKYVIAVIDTKDAVTESNKSNNYIVFGPIQ